MHQVAPAGGVVLHVPARLERPYRTETSQRQLARRERDEDRGADEAEARGDSARGGHGERAGARIGYSATMKVSKQTRRAARCVVLALCLTVSSSAQDTSPEWMPRSRTGTGVPVCGLGKEFHAGRRAALRAALEEGVFVVHGLVGQRAMTRFAQDKTFWYFTGIESPGATLVMDLESGEEILFLPKQDRRGESWNGELWDEGDGWVEELTGFRDVRQNSKLTSTIEALAKGRKVWIVKHPVITVAGSYDNSGPYDRMVQKDPLDGRASREDTLAERLEALTGTKPDDASFKVKNLRLIKQPEEIAAMRRAARAGALAMNEAMRSTRPGLGEWELEHLMSFIQGREGADGPAYGAIVGSGANSLVLHYMNSSRRMVDGEILLLDYGPEVDHYVTDITRTWPVNGKFSERQAEIYDAVLAAQQAAIDVAKPGVKGFAVSSAATKTLNDRGFGGRFQRHGVCHWIGMEVHDPASFGSITLEPGMAFTVEPGLYEASTGIGVRIEDVVLITADGNEVLSRDTPRQREAIERLIAEEGVLDRLGPTVWE
jgi:Xaa-Pro aminopeptidase